MTAPNRVKAPPSRCAPAINPTSCGQESTPEALLELIALGDEISFARLYDQFAIRVLRSAQRVLRDPAQAEEVAQEVFIEIWTRAATFDRTLGTALAWILTITHREAIDRVRRSQSSRQRDHLHSAADFERDHESVHDQVHQEMDVITSRTRIEQALQELTPLQQQAIHLAFYDGHTYLAISLILSVPLATVKSRIRDGLLRLRKHYDKVDIALALPLPAESVAREQHSFPAES